MPQKTFEFQRTKPQLHALHLPEGETPAEALHRVLRLPAVGSKRFLTTKVDRCVTGTQTWEQMSPIKDLTWPAALTSTCDIDSASLLRA